MKVHALRLSHPGLMLTHRVLLLAVLWSSASAQAQMLNYGEAISAYRDVQTNGIKLTDSVSPQVAAKARVGKALRENTIVDQQALVQPDGTLKLPANQQNVVIRTSYDQVTRGADGSIRIASPQIDGNVTGNVTLYVEGDGVRNITVLNNP